MRIEGHKKLGRQMRHLPVASRAQLAGAIEKSIHEGVRVANILAPDVTGKTKGKIHAEFRDGGMTGEVQVIAPDAPQSEKDRAYSIEHGRKRGVRGVTFGFHFVHRTRQYLAKRWRGRIKRAVKKAVKEAARHG